MEIVIYSTCVTSKDRDKSNSIATFWLTFYGSLNFRFPGRNGFALLPGMTTIYFKMILFSLYYNNTTVYDKE